MYDQNSTIEKKDKIWGAWGESEKCFCSYDQESLMDQDQS